MYKSGRPKIPKIRQGNEMLVACRTLSRTVVERDESVDCLPACLPDMMVREMGGSTGEVIFVVESFLGGMFSKQ